MWALPGTHSCYLASSQCWVDDYLGNQFGSAWGVSWCNCRAWGTAKWPTGHHNLRITCIGTYWCVLAPVSGTSWTWSLHTFPGWPDIASILSIEGCLSSSNHRALEPSCGCKTASQNVDTMGNVWHMLCAGTALETNRIIKYGHSHGVNFVTWHLLSACKT